MAPRAHGGSPRVGAAWRRKMKKMKQRASATPQSDAGASPSPRRITPMRRPSVSPPAARKGPMVIRAGSPSPSAARSGSGGKKNKKKTKQLPAQTTDGEALLSTLLARGAKVSQVVGVGRPDQWASAERATREAVSTARKLGAGTRVTPAAFPGVDPSLAKRRAMFGDAAATREEKAAFEALPLHEPYDPTMTYVDALEMARSLHVSKRELRERVAWEMKQGSLCIGDDVSLEKDLHARRQLFALLLSYRAGYLRLGLELVCGERVRVPMGGELDDAVRVFVQERFLFSKKLHRRFWHAAGGWFKPGYDTELKRLALRHFLALVLLLDTVKATDVVVGGGSLFRDDASMRSSESMLREFARLFMPSEGDIVRHLALIGFTVTVDETPADPPPPPPLRVDASALRKESPGEKKKKKAWDVPVASTLSGDDVEWGALEYDAADDYARGDDAERDYWRSWYKQDTWRDRAPKSILKKSSTPQPNSADLANFDPTDYMTDDEWVAWLYAERRELEAQWKEEMRGVRKRERVSFPKWVHARTPMLRERWSREWANGGEPELMDTDDEFRSFVHDVKQELRQRFKRMYELPAKEPIPAHLDHVFRDWARLQGSYARASLLDRIGGKKRTPRTPQQIQQEKMASRIFKEASGFRKYLVELEKVIGSDFEVYDFSDEDHDGLGRSKHSPPRSPHASRSARARFASPRTTPGTPRRVTFSRVLETHHAAPSPGGHGDVYEAPGIARVERRAHTARHAPRGSAVEHVARVERERGSVPLRKVRNVPTTLQHVSKRLPDFAPARRRRGPIDHYGTPGFVALQPGATHEELTHHAYYP